MPLDDCGTHPDKRKRSRDEGRAAALVYLGRAPGLPSGARRLTRLAPSTTLRVDVVLSGRDPLGLERLASAVSTPGSADFRQYLRPASFARRFGATTSTLATVAAELRRIGLKPGAPDANHLAIPVVASAATLSRAFSVQLASYRLSGGRIAYAPTTAPLVPRVLAAEVSGVVGLDDLAVEEARPLAAPASAAKPEAARASAATGPQPCSTVQALATANGPYTMDSIAAEYGMDSVYAAGDVGAGVTLALIEFEPDNPGDIAQFEQCYGLSTNISYIPVDGGAGAPTANSGIETDLDVDVVSALAPAATVDVYQAPPGDIYDIFAQIIDADTAAVISTSWGLCEPQTTAATITSEGTLFEQAAVQGESVVAAAGDAGAEDCDGASGTALSGLAVDNPSSQPFVTGVGGTSLAVSSGTETAWNETNQTIHGRPGGAGGGGISTEWAMPDYQAALAAPGVVGPASSGTPCAATSGDCRELPDVSANADPLTGYVIFTGGAAHVYGGTSAAAPLWGALATLADASSACAQSGPVGFLNPGLYAIAAGPNYSAAFRDIAVGDNVNREPGVTGGGYSAAAGYDMTTGLGTPVAANAAGTGLIAQLCNPARPARPIVTVISPGSGPAIGGTVVTIKGSGFSGANAVFFGTSASPRVTVDSASQLTVTLPAGVGTVDVVVRTLGGTSARSTADRFTYAGSGTPPRLKSVAPRAGPLLGGTSVLLRGTHLSGTSAVRFGKRRASSFKVTAAGTIIARSPPGRGTVKVTVVTAGGVVLGGGNFRYLARPRIVGLQPASGSVSGGTTVIVHGSGFLTVRTVVFGGHAARRFHVVSANELIAVAPAGTRTVAVAVTTRGGTSRRITAAHFTYKVHR